MSARRSPAAVPALCLLSFASCGGGGSQPGGAPAALASGSGLALLGPPPAPLGILSARAIDWRSGSAGAYEVELFPTGVHDAGALLDSGTIEAGGRQSVTVLGTDLELGEQGVVVIRVTDEVGAVSELLVEVELESVATIPLVPGDYRDLEFVAGLQHIDAAEVFTGLVRVHDAAVQSASFGTLLDTLPPGPDVGPFRFEAAPLAERGYAMYAASVLEIDLATTTVRDIAVSPSSLPLFDLAMTPAGDRGYLAGEDGLLVLQASSDGSAPVIEPTGVFDGAVDGGSVAVSPDGKLALVAWFDEYDFGLWVVDIDPLSESFHTILAEPIAPTFGPPAKVAVAPSGSAAFVGGAQGTAKVELAPDDFALVVTRPDLAFDGLSVAEGDDGERLLEWTFAGPLRVLDLELDLLGEIEVGTDLLDRAAVDPEGERLFLVRNASTANVEIAVLPLR